jgi:hypothetical protein
MKETPMLAAEQLMEVEREAKAILTAAARLKKRYDKLAQANG